MSIQDQSIEHLEQFRAALDTDGFVVFRDVVSKDGLVELEGQLAEAYDAAEREGQLFRGGGSYTGHLNCYPGRAAQFVSDDLQRFGVIDMVGAVRPDIADQRRLTMNYNLPGSVPQHYHSDGLYVEEFLICNVAVVDTDIRNGALDVLPGTHRSFLKFWQYALGRKSKLSTRVPLSRGDVVVRKSTLWHRGMPNTTSRPRPMLALTFGEMAAERGDASATFDGDIAFFPNWYSTSRLGQLRERVYVAAPITYATYRFVKSLRGNKGYDHW